MMVAVSAIVGFFLGVLAVLGVEVGLFVLLIRWLSKKSSQSAKSGVVSSAQHPLDSSQSLSSIYQKQGVLWVLEPQKVPEVPSSAEQTRKREMVVVTPVRKLAKIKDRMLILTEVDGSLSKIILKGCQVQAVSATSLPTRKWAKRFPMKVESKTAVLYHGSKVLYLFAETSWEKESWCKALRLASSDDKERLRWFSKLNEEFRIYLKALTEGHPSLIKPSVGHHIGVVDKPNHLDDPPSKVRQFFRKISKKASALALDEKRISDKSRVHQDPVSNMKGTVPAKIEDSSVEDSPSVSSTAFSRSGSSNHVSETSEADTSERSVVDEGTLCWNLLICRLFFDAKNNADIKTALKARIQRTLSNMRTPSYIGELTCTDVDPGNLPPYILAMRAVPTDMSDLWALEMDVEYSGGVALDIEARLEMRELDFYNGVVNSNAESSSVAEVTPDLLEDFKHLEDELRLSDGAVNSPEKEAENHKGDQLRSSGTGLPSATPASRWKFLLNSVAKHVSQVPLVLTIKVASMKGTVQLHMKPPPSDQLWFGFTSMPDINFQVECCVKDHKITSGRIPSFFINRFKASIRETLVLPNCESAYVSWMLAEKDDWVPVNAAPLMWLNRESPSDSAASNEVSQSPSIRQRSGERDQDSKDGKQKKADGGKVASCTLSQSSEGIVPPNDLKTSLLRNEGTRDLIIQRKEENPEHLSPSRYVSLKEERNSIEDDDGKSKKTGRRAKMLDLGKKMGEKLEEKRRHLEEKSRHIVEKMRGT